MKKVSNLFDTEVDINDLSEEEKNYFNKAVSCFFSEVSKILDTFKTDREKVEWFSEMERLFKEEVNKIGNHLETTP